MKTNITLLFLLVTLQLCAQSDTDTLINQRDSLGLRQGKWIFFEEDYERLYGEFAEIHMDFLNDTIHGKYKVYDVNGVLRFDYRLIKGIRVGTAYEYYRSGKIYRIYYHVADREAYTIEFDHKGKLYSEYHQKEGKLVKSYKTYKKGKLYIVKNYNEDGQLDRPFIYYYKNGQEEHVLLFEDNELLRQKRYTRSGKLEYDSDLPGKKDW